MLANEVDRQQEEAALRLAIALPILVLGAVVTSRTGSLLWVRLAFAVSAILVADGHRRTKKVGDLVLNAIQGEQAVSPDWKRVGQDIERVKQRLAEADGEDA